MADKIELSKYVMWGKTQIKQNLMGNPYSKIFSDLFEALIGAIFLDGGYKTTRKVLFKILEINLKKNEN